MHSLGERLWDSVAPARSDDGPVAVIHQAIDPPVLDGAVKPANPHGYLDSSADIAHALAGRGHAVVTRRPEPSPERDADWAYPDSTDGIAEALAAGSRVLWANTTLFRDHPLAGFSSRAGIKVVGQKLSTVERFEDKHFCHQVCQKAGILVPRQAVVTLGAARRGTVEAVKTALGPRRWNFPVVVKPLRGRGSDGVRLVGSLDEAITHIDALRGETSILPDGSAVSRYGGRFLIEEYLPGDEWTVTVMPPGRYRTGEGTGHVPDPWVLPPVGRTGHSDGVLPYSGQVAVTDNSAPVPDATVLRKALLMCEEVGRQVGNTAPIRIDCRQDERGAVRIFDINLKPNMTGPGRPGRDHMVNLAGMAAQTIGWAYPDLLTAMASNAVPVSRTTETTTSHRRVQCDE